VRLLKFILITLCFNCYASSSYLHKFKTYQHWYLHLPLQASPEFLSFIGQPGPLAARLRDKWLNHLGEKQQWSLFLNYYQPSQSPILQCYAASAYWELNQRPTAIKIATPLWLQGLPQPKACDHIFHTLAQVQDWRRRYWSKRIAQALDNHQLLLARQLLHRGSKLDAMAADQFWKVHTQPSYFKRLPQGPWRGEQTLYALKRMIEGKHKTLFADYHYTVQNHILNRDQQQRFLAHYSLYAFMRHQPDANIWLQQVEHSYRHPNLKEWQMRYAIQNQAWSQIELAIQSMPRPFTAEQIYWLAQSQKHLGKPEQAKQNLEQLAKQRNYYGFLSSRELHRPPSFQEQKAQAITLLPREYQGLLQEIQQLYQTKTLGRAAQMLNDFILELPIQEQCALVNWVMNHLNWPTQAIVLSNKPELINQVTLRFPTKYADFVVHRARQLRLEPAYVYAIIRQESAFHPKITSPVGARGLMQMMPTTAKLISKTYKIPYRVDEELFTPYKNIEIGTQYLAHLSKLYGNHPLLVAAAYNAGPHTVNRWVRASPHTNVIAWIDSLPWKETRNYLKNIIAFQTIYQHRLGHHTNMENLLTAFPHHSSKKA